MNIITWQDVAVGLLRIVILVTLVVMLAGGIFAIFAVTQVPVPHACADYIGYRVRDRPVECLSYWIKR
jgi:hypothetical protein